MIISNNIYPQSRAYDNFPNPIREHHLKQPAHAYDPQGQLEQQHTVNRIYERF
jgi:hypothetical protein